MTVQCESPRFTMYGGDDRILNFEVKDEDGEAVDIDTATASIFAMFTAEGVESFRLTLDDGITLAGNIVTVTIPNATSALLLGEYAFELELTDATDLIHTLAQGSATVKRKYIQ